MQWHRFFPSLTRRLAMGRLLSLLPLLSLLIVVCLLLTACAAHGPSTPGWVTATSNGEPVALVFASAGDRQHALGEFEKGLLVLDFGGADTEIRPGKAFVKVPLDQISGRYRLELPRKGRYQIRLSRGADGDDGAYFRVSPAPAKVAAAPLPDRSQAAADQGICEIGSGPLTVPVGDVFAEGEWVRDFYSGQRAQVVNGQVTLTPAADAAGLLLLEPAEAPSGSFTWKGATVYFVVTDRFANGRENNDHSYGRSDDGEQEIGTFHGGDLAGLTEKLDYLDKLGVNALWITPPFEQMHGWVGGGNRGDFKHYAYHGYYGLDFTRLDANFGTPEELRTLVREAHARDIRVLLDVVMNHPGYSTLQDMQAFDFGGLRDGFEQYLPEQWGDWEPQAYEDYHDYHALIDYEHTDWANWWGKDWVRAGIADYDTPPNVAIDEQRGSLAFLPDFKTESDQTVGLPVFLQKKGDTGARPLENATVRDYLITWLTDWVREFGIDGFRVDTAKHVEPEAWAELKQAAQQALDDYRAEHPDQALPAEDFWMVAEVFPHSVTRSAYFDSGFDAVINFDFQTESALDGAKCLPRLEPVYARYAEKLNGENPFNVMSYISSHDTRLFSSQADGDPILQKRVAAALMLLPGAVQIFYGDESGRAFGPTGSDAHQGTRSDMNWDAIAAGEVDGILAHWRKLGQFRDRHPAIGAGAHQALSEQPYVFSRTLSRNGNSDRVIVAFSQE